MVFRSLFSGACRGTAAFIGGFLTANGVAQAVGSAPSHDIWLVDLQWLPFGVGWFASVLVGGTLLAYAVLPRLSARRRTVTAAAAAVLAVSAIRGIAGFYAAWQAGSIEPQIPVPLSALVAFLAAVMAVAAWTSVDETPHPRAEKLVAVLTAVALVLAFPLAQVAFFGKTDYRRPANVAVVLGARVMPSGALSGSLEDRVQTSVDLYRQGLVETLIMSGGIDANGIDEAAAMRARAVSLGVPPDRVLTDNAGVNTDATVANTCAMIEQDESVLVVSQFYHLPRIKLAYQSVGRNVYTVPAIAPRPIVKTPLFVAREVPGFWVYWARSLVLG